MSARRLPAEIYWRRRLLALAAVLGLVWIVLQVTGGDDDDPAAAPVATTTTPTQPTPTPSAAPVNGVIEVNLVGGTARCDPQLVRVTPTVRPDQLTRGNVDVGLVVSSTESTPCTLDPGDADLVAVISANGTAIWDSTVCKTSLLADPVAITPQWATVVTTVWTGRGSGADCSPKEGYATPGQYVVQVGTLGGEPGKTSFTLERRPTPKATTPTPKVTPTKATPSAKKTTKPTD